MKKKVLLLLSALAALAVIGFLSVQLFWYFNPEVTVRYSYGTNKSIPSVSFNTRSLFGLPKAVKKRIKVFSDKNDALALPLLLKYDAARKIIGEVKNTEDGTLIIYYGWGMSQNGTAESFHEEAAMDFVLTDNIEERGDRNAETRAYYIYPAVEGLEQDKAIEDCRISAEILQYMNDIELARAVADFPLLSSIMLGDSGITEREKMLSETSDAYKELKNHSNYTDSIKAVALDIGSEGNADIAGILLTLVE